FADGASRPASRILSRSASLTGSEENSRTFRRDRSASQVSTPGTLTDEGARLVEVRDAGLDVRRLQGHPLAHRPPLARVEPAALAGRDQLRDPRRRQLHHELVLADESEELAPGPQAGRVHDLGQLDVFALAEHALRGGVEQLVHLHPWIMPI